MRSHSYHVFGPRINAWWFASRRVSWTESMNQFRESMIRERMKISKPCYRLFLDTFLIVVCVIELFWWKPQAENSKGHILIQYVDWFHITNAFPRFGSLWTSLRQSFSCLFGLFHQHQKVPPQFDTNVSIQLSLKFRKKDSSASPWLHFQNQTTSLLCVGPGDLSRLLAWFRVASIGLRASMVPPYHWDDMFCFFVFLCMSFYAWCIRSRTVS